jgi:hypothetical protein
VIRVAGGNPNEVERLLTERILMDFLQFHMKKRKQYLKKPSGKKKKMSKHAVLDQPPCMPTSFKEKITGPQGSNIKLVIQKELTITDMNASQDRLSIPRDQMRFDFLSSEEKVILEKKEANGIHFKGMEVPLIEPGLQVSSIFLKKWKLGRSSCFMLSKPWMDVAKRNELKPGNNVQLWSFRVNQKPHLALM